MSTYYVMLAPSLSVAERAATVRRISEMPGVVRAGAFAPDDTTSVFGRMAFAECESAQAAERIRGLPGVESVAEPTVRTIA